MSKCYLATVILGFILSVNIPAKASDIVIQGVANPVISLNGKWKICLNPVVKADQEVPAANSWQDIAVPGECMMQGYSIQHDRPFIYKKEFVIPADYKGNRIKLHFEGVYSYARIWVNGKYIRDHSGGFTAWGADITNVITPGKTAIVMVEVTDRKDEISYASGYAKHPIGGILGNVSLMALPANYPDHIVITTDFDDNYKNAYLNIRGTIRKSQTDTKIEVELFDKKNQKVTLSNKVIAIRDSVFNVNNLIQNPLKMGC